MKRSFAIALGLILYFCFSAWDRQKAWQTSSLLLV